MTSPARRPAAALAAVLLLSACSGGDAGTSPPNGTSSAAASSSEPASACEGVVDGVVATAQRYVDRYGTATSDGRPSSEVPNLEQALEGARSRLTSLGCDPDRTGRLLTSGLEGIETSGPLADAVKRQLVATMTGAAATVASTRRVGTADDLREVLPELAPGSTVRLARGTHRLRDTVVLLQAVRIVGAGRGRTTLSSSAGDAALLALTQDRVDLRGLTLRHVGSRPASLVVGGAATSLALDRVGVVGAASGTTDGADPGAQARGGSGVLMAAGRGSDDDERRTTLEVTDSVFRGNEAAGILLSGGHAASVLGSRFLDGGQCGICFVGTSSGVVRDARFTGGVTGVIAADRAAPLLVGSTVTGTEIGVQAVGRATPVVRRTTVTGAKRAALLFGDRSRGRVDAATCRANRFDIVVAPTAVPFLGDNRCSVQPMG